MKPRAVLSFTVLLTATAAAAGASDAPDRPTFPGGVSAVVLDVVVRDGRGRMVRDLRASDFSVFDDGALQTVESFQVVSRGDEPSAAPAESSPESATERSDKAVVAATSVAVAAPGPSLVALVFDHISAGTRDFARRAGLSYVAQVHRRGDVVAVFAIDLSLRVVLPLTDDPQQIRAGVERAVVLAQGAGDAQQVRAERRRRNEELAATEQYVEQLMRFAATSSQDVGGSKVRLATARHENDMEDVSLALDRERQGLGATGGLTAIVRALGGARGRKTLVLFSEGLSIPTSGGAFRSLVDAANRANVSVYAVDTGGLRAVSAVSEAREELDRSLQLHVRQLLTSRSAGADGSLNRTLERSEDSSSVDPASTLGPLASETGGLLVSDTNDVGKRFREMAEDMRFHYIVSYSPRSERCDGRFRKLSVKIGRKGVEVRTRRGYLATCVAAAHAGPEGAAPRPAHRAN